MKPFLFAAALQGGGPSPRTRSSTARTAAGPWPARLSATPTRSGGSRPTRSCATPRTSARPRSAWSWARACITTIFPSSASVKRPTSASPANPPRIVRPASSWTSVDTGGYQLRPGHRGHGGTAGPGVSLPGQPGRHPRAQFDYRSPVPAQERLGSGVQPGDRGHGPVHDARGRPRGRHRAQRAHRGHQHGGQDRHGPESLLQRRIRRPIPLLLRRPGSFRRPRTPGHHHDRRAAEGQLRIHGRRPGLPGRDPCAPWPTTASCPRPCTPT